VGTRRPLLLVALVASANAACQPWCDNPCPELNGDVTQECNDCSDSNGCYPAAPGYNRKQDSGNAAEARPDREPAMIRATVGADGSAAAGPSPSRPPGCQPDLHPGALQDVAAKRLKLLIGLASCDDVIRLKLCDFAEAREACATSCGLCESPSLASARCHPDLTPTELLDAALPLLQGLHSCADVLRLELCAEDDAMRGCATSCGLCGPASEATR